MKIVVLAGGISPERDVSLVTGKNVYEALKSKGHETILMDVYFGHDGPLEHIWEESRDTLRDVLPIDALAPDLEAVKAMRDPKYTHFFGPNVIELCQEADVVFMGLHGANGENGRIQAYFDLCGITYTGTDMLSSAICMDKSLSKELMEHAGVPTPRYVDVYKGEEIPGTIAYPCVVKAVNGGSSVGVCIANNDKEYEEAVEECLQLDEHLIVEEYIKGREFSIGVIDGKAMPIIEIAPKEGFYDYKNKYQAGSCVETCPAELGQEKTSAMQRLAERVFKALRLRHYARMDFLMDEQGGMYCLEANTLPGMTATSLVPQEAKAMGISFEDLCEMLVLSAKE